MLNKYIIALILIALAGGTGYYLGTGNVETVIQEKIIQGKTVEVEKIVTITRIVRPDGTVEETTRTEDKKIDSTSTEIARDESIKSLQKEYSLGIQFHSDYKDILNIVNQVQDKDNYTVQLGRRLIGPVWAEVGVGFNQYNIGVKWEF